MAVATQAITEHVHEAHASSDWKLRTNRLGLWLFFVSEAFIFGGLLVSRFFLWGGTRPELDQSIPIIITVVLLISSFFMNRAEVAIAHDDYRTFSRSMIITGFLGTVFLLGVIFFEWGFRIEDGQFILGNHISPTSGVYGAVLYGMTGMHALHVLSGIILIAIVWNKGRMGLYTPKEHWGVEACAIYWHYVDLIWVFFYPAIYLVGTAVAPAMHG